MGMILLNRNFCLAMILDAAEQDELIGLGYCLTPLFEAQGLGLEAVAWVLDSMMYLPDADFGASGPFAAYCDTFRDRGLEELLMPRVLARATQPLLDLLCGLAYPPTLLPGRLKILGMLREAEASTRQDEASASANFYVEMLVEYMEDRGEGSFADTVAPSIRDPSATYLNLNPPTRVREPMPQLTREKCFEMMRQAETEGHLVIVSYKLVWEMEAQDLGLHGLEWVLDAMVAMPNASFWPFGLFVRYCEKFKRQGLEKLLLPRAIKNPTKPLVALLAGMETDAEGSPLTEAAMIKLLQDVIASPTATNDAREFAESRLEVIHDPEMRGFLASLDSDVESPP